MMLPLRTLLLPQMLLLLKGLHRIPDQILVAGAAMGTLAAVAMVGVVVMVVGATEAAAMAAVAAMAAAVVKNVVGL